ncbi:hypothetical protein ACEQ8H_007379 [Pleosporales sp. CAS-2024a]
MAGNSDMCEKRMNHNSSRLKTSVATTAKKFVAASVTQPDPNIIGSWLCDQGPYRDYIEALSGSNPGLKKADPNNKEGPLKRGNAGVVLLDSPGHGQPDFTQPRGFKNSTELREHLESSIHNHNCRRIYGNFLMYKLHTRHMNNFGTPVMEGLAPDYTAVIGGHFFMEPTFFQRQERTCVWSNDFTPEESTVGILRRKISWWSRQTAKGGWDVVILCDPQLADLSPDPKELVGGELRDIENVGINLKNKPFQEGYQNFLPTISFDSAPSPEVLKALSQNPHPHASMLKDLIYFYQYHSRLLTPEEWKTPQKSAVFLKKIVAAHYLQLVDYIKVMLPSLELRLTTAWVEEQDQWKSLQTISRRCGNYRDYIEDALLSLGYPLDGKLDESSKLRTADWKDCEKDFQYAYFRLKILKERADNLTTSMTGLASIAGNRQNLEEAKRVKRLNLLALLFIPLAYTSSLFSMQDPYMPNQPHFWVYWISATGAVAFTSLVTFILDRALDDEAQWTWAPIKYLKFWKLRRWRADAKPTPVQRKANSPTAYDAIRNAATCALLGLPGEIRNLIYTYVFSIGTFTFHANFAYSRKPRPNFFGGSQAVGVDAHLFALMRVCRKIRPELANFYLPFALNTFAFNLFFRLSAFYVHLTDEQRGWISSIDVEVQLGSAQGMGWFVEGWRERGVTSLRDVMPGVKRVHVRAKRMRGLLGPEQNKLLEEDEETLMGWLNGGQGSDINVTVGRVTEE